MAKFLFVFRGGGATVPDLSAAERGANLHNWRTWIAQLASDARIEPGGHPVQMTGRTLRGRAMTLTETPYDPGRDVLTGTLLVRAADLEEATELAHGCPVFDHEGSVEIRPVLERPA